ncbi:MAG: TAXI family TRAP transporter solute-binding subunit [Thermodesulfobacteriota bacterium]
MHSRYLSKILIVALISALAIASFAGVASAQKKQPISLVIATATTGGTYYPIGVGMASLWSIKLADKHKIMVQAITSAGSGENINMLKGKEVDLVILQGLFGKMAWNGIGIYEGNPYKELRTITMLWPNVEHFVIFEDKVKTGTATDIRGLRFSIGRAGSGTEMSGLTIMEGLGMKREDVKGEYLDYFGSSAAMKDKRIDGANLVAGPPVAAVTDIFASPGMKAAILEFTDEQLKEINEKTAYPGFRYVIPANMYPGQAKPVQSIAQPNFLGVRADVDKEVIKLLTKTLFDNPDYLKAVHKMGAFITLEKALSGLPAPLHPGAYEYYKERGFKIPTDLIPPGAS